MFHTTTHAVSATPTQVPAHTPALRRRVVAVLAAALAIVVALALTACGSGASSASGTSTGSTQGSASASASAKKVTFTDDAGNKVTVKNPQRVVVGMGSLADIWRDAGGELVGVSDDAYDNFGFSKKIAGIGRHTNPSLEKIMALNPDLVIMSGQSEGDGSYKGPSQADVKNSLEKSGIPVAFFSVSTFDEYLHMLKICTQITGRADLYKKNGTDVQARIASALKKYDVSAKAPTVLVLNASSRGASAQDPTHMASMMVKQLGGKLVTEEHPSLLKDFSMEAVAEIDPDYIFVLPAATSDAIAKRNYENAVEKDPAWANITAVKDKHVTVLDLKHFFRKPNAEWDQAYVTLGRALATLD